MGDSGLSDAAIEQLARKGNDLKKLADGPAVGVETALAELHKDPNTEILHTGRPGPGKPVNAPDVVAVDRRTGRTIVVEAKKTDGAKPLSRTRLRSTEGGQDAADALQRIVDGEPYDVRIGGSRPSGQGIYGTHVDQAVDEIRAGGQVADIHFVLDPGRDPRASLVQHDGMWRARLGDADLPGAFRGPRAAKRAVWDPLREQPDGRWAVALLDKLFRESFRL